MVGIELDAALRLLQGLVPPVERLEGVRPKRICPPMRWRDCDRIARRDLRLLLAALPHQREPQQAAGVQVVGILGDRLVEERQRIRAPADVDERRRTNGRLTQPRGGSRDSVGPHVIEEVVVRAPLVREHREIARHLEPRTGAGFDLAQRMIEILASDRARHAGRQ